MSAVHPDASVLTVVLAVPALRGLFGFAAVDATAAPLATAHGAVLVLLLDAVELRRRGQAPP